VKRTSRSKVERIMIKIMRSISVRVGNTKRGACGARRSGEWEDTVALAKVYSWFFARAGSTMYLFFFY
jgi:hypothetical protein